MFSIAQKQVESVFKGVPGEIEVQVGSLGKQQAFIARKDGAEKNRDLHFQLSMIIFKMYFMICWKSDTIHWKNVNVFLWMRERGGFLWR